MRYSKVKIKELILDQLRSNGFTPIDITEKDGYFLFRSPKNSIFHFFIKEIPYWKFGLWIHNQKDEKYYSVSLFGEKIDWINKFKPSACTLSATIKVPYYDSQVYKGDFLEPDYAYIRISNKLNLLKNSRIITEYSFSSGYKSFLRWYPSEFWFYNIEKPITDWWEDVALGWVLKPISKYIGFKYRKYLKSRPVIDQHEEYYSPKWVVGVEYYEDCDDDDCKRTYFELEDSWMVKFIESNNASFRHYDNPNDMRGFYYKNDQRLE